MPDFICIGGQRTGTTWLHHVLSANDTIWMPPCKELHHYDAICPDVSAYPYRYREHLGSRFRHYALAASRIVTRKNLRPDVNVRLDWDWDLKYFTGLNRSRDWYASLFNVRSSKGRVTGEITPAYSMLPKDAVEGIHRDFPHARIILILREPLSRAWSHALKDLPAERASDSQEIVKFMRDPDCFERSNWPEITKRWQSVFPAEQFLVLDFEQIRKQPETIISTISDFLGVELKLPPATGGSLRERGSSTYKGDGLTDEIRSAVADLYNPVIDETAALYPEIAAGWNRV